MPRLASMRLRGSGPIPGKIAQAFPTFDLRGASPTLFHHWMKNVAVRAGVALLAVAMLGISACRKDADRPQWDVDLVGPLVSSTFTISDIVADTNMDVAENGLITIVYRDELFGVDLDTIFHIPDTSFVYPYAVTFGSVTLSAGATLPPINEVAGLDVDEVQLRNLELREGTLTIALENELSSGVIGTFSLPGSSYLGIPVSLTQFVAAASTSGPGVASVTRDLAFHQFDLTGPTFDAVNTLSTQLLLQLDPYGTGATLTPEDTVRAIATYGGLKPQYARGYFGQRFIHVGPEISELDLFDEVIGGSFDLDQVELALKVTNGVGVDARATIDHFTAVNTASSVSLDLASSIVPGPINLNRALDLGSGFQASVYETTLDNSNSNVDQLLEAMPDQTEFEMDIEVNPLGDISNGNDFLYWNSDLSAELELRVPLNLIATGLTLQQTQTPDLPGSTDHHAFQYGMLKLFAVNGFPFEATLQLELVDDAGNVLATLPLSGTIAAGILGPDLHVQTAVASQLSTTLTSADVDLLYADGTRVRSTLVFSTADQTQHLEILDSYALDLRIVFDGNYLVNGDE